MSRAHQRHGQTDRRTDRRLTIAQPQMVCRDGNLLSLDHCRDMPSRILTCTEQKGHWRLFVLVSSFNVCFLAACARLS